MALNFGFSIINASYISNQITECDISAFDDHFTDIVYNTLTFYEVGSQDLTSGGTQIYPTLSQFGSQIGVQINDFTSGKYLLIKYSGYNAYEESSQNTLCWLDNRQYLGDGNISVNNYENIVFSYPGCNDSNACNAGSFLYPGDCCGINDGGACDYPELNYDCNGNCIVDIDCSGDCGGTLEVDDCGVCGGDNTTGCYDNNCTTYCDCDGNREDCFGECGGDAEVDQCLECGGDGIDCPCGTHEHCQVTLGLTDNYCHSSGVCVTYDGSFCDNNYCGIGDGDCDNDGHCDVGLCWEDHYDQFGESSHNPGNCTFTSTDSTINAAADCCFDPDDECPGSGTWHGDCPEQCGGGCEHYGGEACWTPITGCGCEHGLNAGLDQCGVCEGEGTQEVCCDGETEVCDNGGDGMSADCYGIVCGCMDGDACNYNAEATVDGGSCTYAEDGLEWCEDPDGDELGSFQEGEEEGDYYCPRNSSGGEEAPEGWVNNCNDECEHDGISIYPEGNNGVDMCGVCNGGCNPPTSGGAQDGCPAACSCNCITLNCGLCEVVQNNYEDGTWTEEDAASYCTMGTGNIDCEWDCSYYCDCDQNYYDDCGDCGGDVSVDYEVGNLSDFCTSTQNECDIHTDDCIEPNLYNCSDLLNGSSCGGQYPAVAGTQENKPDCDNGTCNCIAGEWDCMGVCGGTTPDYTGDSCLSGCSSGGCDIPCGTPLPCNQQEDFECGIAEDCIGTGCDYLDCGNACGGDGLVNNCNACIGTTTGGQYDNFEDTNYLPDPFEGPYGQDCDGECFSGAGFDEFNNTDECPLNHCIGGESTNEPCVTDCNGTYYVEGSTPPNSYDCAGICSSTENPDYSEADGICCDSASIFTYYQDTDCDYLGEGDIGDGVLYCAGYEPEDTCPDGTRWVSNNVDFCIDDNIDQCGVCGGDNSTCCTDPDACNYIEGRHCEYPEINYDCDGHCIAEASVHGQELNEGGYDCNGVCAGRSILDQCGVCNGPGTMCVGCTDNRACNYDQYDTIDFSESNVLVEGECIYADPGYDCDGNCIIEIDECHVCGGDGITGYCASTQTSIFQSINRCNTISNQYNSGYIDNLQDAILTCNSNINCEWINYCDCDGSVPDVRCPDGSFVCNIIDCHVTDIPTFEPIFTSGCATDFQFTSFVDSTDINDIFSDNYVDGLSGQSLLTIDHITEFGSDQVDQGIAHYYENENAWYGGLSGFELIQSNNYDDHYSFKNHSHQDVISSYPGIIIISKPYECEILGCTNDYAPNYDENATVDDGTCECFDANVAPFTCESAVDQFGCDMAWGGSTIGEMCPVSCDPYCQQVHDNCICVGCPLMGDVNGDGVVDILDIIMITSYLLGDTDFRDVRCGDMGGDGGVDVLDIVQIITLIFGDNLQGGGRVTSTTLTTREKEILSDVRNTLISIENVDIETQKTELRKILNILENLGDNNGT